MDIKNKIQELSLDQKAKLYYMALLQKGTIDTLPEDPKAAYIRDMMDKEDPKMDPAIRSDFDEPMFENDEDDEGGKPEGYDDIPDSLKEAASKLGYLKEIDLNAISAKKASFVYTEQGGRFYSLTLSTSDGQTLKMKYDEANEWLKDTLAYIHEGDLIPRRYNSGLEDLDLIVARLEELGIEASHGDYMDVS